MPLDLTRYLRVSRIARTAVLALGAIAFFMATMNVGNAADSLSAARLRYALSLSVTPSTLDVRLGEPVGVTVTMRNGSSEDFWFRHGAALSDYAYTLVDPEGRLVHGTPPGH